MYRTGHHPTSPLDNRLAAPLSFLNSLSWTCILGRAALVHCHPSTPKCHLHTQRTSVYFQHLWLQAETTQELKNRKTRGTRQEIASFWVRGENFISFEFSRQLKTESLLVSLRLAFLRELADAFCTVQQG